MAAVPSLMKSNRFVHLQRLPAMSPPQWQAHQRSCNASTWSINSRVFSAASIVRAMLAVVLALISTTVAASGCTNSADISANCSCKPTTCSRSGSTALRLLPRLFAWRCDPPTPVVRGPSFLPQQPTGLALPETLIPSMRLCSSPSWGSPS